MFYVKVFSKLNDARVDYCVVGGLAVALHGAVRGTVDLDLAISLDQKNLIQVEKCLIELGLVSRIPVNANDIFKFREEYLTKKNLIAWSFVNPRRISEVVDVLINIDAKNFKKITKSLGKLKIPIISIEGLIALKKEAGRPQDLEDVRALERIKS